nr:hypothetical protein [Micromonospora sp. B006]
MQQTLGVGHLVLGGNGTRLGLSDVRGDAVRQVDLPGDFVVAATDAQERSPRKARDVPGQEFMRVSGIQLLVADKGVVDVPELRRQLLRDQVLVDTLFKIPHEGKLAAMNARRKPVR